LEAESAVKAGFRGALYGNRPFGLGFSGIRRFYPEGIHMGFANMKLTKCLLLAVLATGVGCAGTGINKGDFSIISVSEEWQLGEQLSTDIAKEMEVLPGPEINAYINAMGNRILAQASGDTPVASQRWQFHVIDNKEINAFNIPGGHVYVHSGLVARAESYSELASVMGHEVSHGLARHGVENLSKQYGIAVLASLVLGNNPSVYEEILAGVLAGGAVMRFSRDAEREADRLGVAYTYGAGIDPQGMVTFFRKLLEIRQSRPSSIEQFFSSHPLTEDRIRDAQTQINGLFPKSLIRDDTGFGDFQRRVAAAAPAS
jgi:predicted Zn-dependent protease